MGKILDKIEPDQEEWIKKQKMFFVASAPLDSKGLVNTSPKGYDCFRIINSNKVCYLELSGSGIETQSHVEENGRITIMFLSFESSPKILRLLGHGYICRVDSPEFKSIYDEYYSDTELAENPGIRSIVVLKVEKVGISCGFGVPFYEYKGARQTLKNYWSKKTKEQVMDSWAKENATSLDGLPGMKQTSDWGTNFWLGSQSLMLGTGLITAFAAGFITSSYLRR